jgi:hypothetical protein
MRQRPAAPFMATARRRQQRRAQRERARSSATVAAAGRASIKACSAGSAHNGWLRRVARVRLRVPACSRAQRNAQRARSGACAEAQVPRSGWQHTWRRQAAPCVTHLLLRRASRAARRRVAALRLRQRRGCRRDGRETRSDQFGSRRAGSRMCFVPSRKRRQLCGTAPAHPRNIITSTWQREKQQRNEKRQLLHMRYMSTHKLASPMDGARSHVSSACNSATARRNAASARRTQAETTVPPAETTGWAVSFYPFILSPVASWLA